MKKELRTTFNTRQYMTSKHFEIFYYSDTNIKNVEDHTHTYYEFYFLISGLVSINIDGEDYPITAGDMIVIPPNVMHHVTILDQSIPYQRFIFWITEEYCQDLLKQSPDYGYLIQEIYTKKSYIYHYDVMSFNILKSKIFQLIEEIHFERFGKLTKVFLCVNDLILHLNRTVYEMKHPNIPKQEQSLYRAEADRQST